MARFFGAVGYATEAVETAPGVYKEGVVEKEYLGDVLRTSRQLQDGQKVNDDLSVQVTISIIADAFANEHIHAIRYVRWQGSLWKVPDVSVEHPRLLLRLGGIHNGPTP